MKLKGSSGKILCGGAVILDTSEIESEADYGGMLYELKKLGVKNGEEYQIGNAGEILMDRPEYKKCARVLKKFGARAVNL